MKTNDFSPTYVHLIDLLFRTQTMKMDIHQVSMAGGAFQRVKTGLKSDQLQQDFYISASELWAQCTPHEWHLVGRISAELKEYNALWHCDPAIKKSSSNKRAIADLIEKKVLIKTETTDIYIVNPFFIRRGDFKTVLATTAYSLMDAKEVSLEHIKDRKAVKDFNPSPTDLFQLSDRT